MLQYRKYVRNKYFILVSNKLTTLDGIRAFRRIVEQIGEFIIKTNYKYSFDWFYTNTKNKFGRKRVVLNEIEICESNTSRSISAPSLDELITACREQKGFRCRSVALRFAKTA